MNPLKKIQRKKIHFQTARFAGVSSRRWHIVVGLAVVALALVSRNAILPAWKRMVPPKQAATGAAAPSAEPANPLQAPTQPLPPVSSATLARVPDRPVDTAQVERLLPQWMKAPRRDPFQVTVGDQAPPRAEEVLRLSAIWRQSGSRLAVINDKIMGEGESILDFTVETIAEDGLWLQGPRGAENLTFKSHAEPKNQIAATSPGPEKEGLAPK